jgi:hypothetical protein
MAPRLGDGHQTLALAAEDLDPEFVLQLADLLGDARLGGEERLGRRRDIESLTRDLLDIAQLLQIHRARTPNNLWSYQSNSKFLLRPIGAR